MIRRFFIALQFLTRLPVPRALNSAETDIGKAAAFFPLIGVIVGGGGALVFVGLQRILPLPASVLCAIVFATLITNGFHEDGLADAFDGFGGCWTKDRVLRMVVGRLSGPFRPLRAS